MLKFTHATITRTINFLYGRESNLSRFKKSNYHIDLIKTKKLIFGCDGLNYQRHFEINKIYFIMPLHFFYLKRISIDIKIEIIYNNYKHPKKIDIFETNLKRKCIFFVKSETQYLLKVGRESRDNVLPDPDETMLKIIKMATGEDRKLEIAEKLLYQWLQNQPKFPNDFGK